MRFKHKPLPCHGDTRIIQRFLWMPVTDGKTTRWLEHALIKQTFGMLIGGGDVWWDWVDQEFID